MKAQDDIERKAAMIRGDVAYLEQRKVLFAEMNNSDIAHANNEEQLAFQRARLEAAEWAVTASEEEIRTRHTMESAVLGPWVDAKYTTQQGVPREITQRIAVVELLELALGEHPVQRR